MSSKEPVPPPKEHNVAVQIRGDHPHTGRFGFIHVVDGMPEHINLFGKGMVKVTFENGDGCFAELHNVAKVAPPPAPPRKRR